MRVAHFLAVAVGERGALHPLCVGAGVASVVVLLGELLVEHACGASGIHPVGGAAPRAVRPLLEQPHGIVVVAHSVVRHLHRLRVGGVGVHLHAGFHHGGRQRDLDTPVGDASPASLLDDGVGVLVAGGAGHALQPASGDEHVSVERVECFFLLGEFALQCFDFALEFGDLVFCFGDALVGGGFLRVGGLGVVAGFVAFHLGDAQVFLGQGECVAFVVEGFGFRCDAAGEFVGFLACLLPIFFGQFGVQADGLAPGDDVVVHLCAGVLGVQGGDEFEDGSVADEWACAAVEFALRVCVGGGGKRRAVCFGTRRRGR